MTAWRWIIFGHDPGVLHIDSAWRPTNPARGIRHSPLCGQLNGPSEDLGTEDLGSVRRCLKCASLMLEAMSKPKQEN